MEKLLGYYKQVVDWLDCAAVYGAGRILIRLLMAYEFGKAGLGKLNGTNWFANVQDNFIFPFNVIPVDISWFLATWFEILGAFGLLLGLFTRFWAFTLIIIMESTSFYMILPSSTKSSDDIYPKNTASAFRIRIRIRISYT